MGLQRQGDREMSNENNGRGCLMVLGVLSVFAGFIAIGSPLMTGAIVTSVIGAMLLLNGILELVNAFSAGGWKAGLLAFLGGALAIIAGGMIMAQPVIGSAIISIMLIVFFFADGFARTILAFKLKPMPGWGWQLFSGIVSLILGLMIWQHWPLSGLWAIGVLIGVRILFAGLAMLMLRGVVRQIEKTL
jgi:uncharacterized membrane protein HdeD (DUF308 family)